jgi:hypothetical protein
MSDFTLYLDSVAFQEFEIPDSIKAGGSQALFKHKYPGGARTIDTMGPDDDDITWSGTFMDGTAQDRCAQLDVMRRQGNQVVATWAGYQYLVVIAEFKWDFRRFWEIPYTITLAVVQDQTQPMQSYAPDVDSQTISDVGYATTYCDTIGVSIGGLSATLSSPIIGAASALSTAVAGVNSTIASIGSISGGTVDSQAALGVQVGAAMDISQGLQSTLDEGLTAAGNPALFASGTSPQNMIASLQNLSGLSSALAANVDCSNTLGRMSINIGQLGS